MISDLTQFLPAERDSSARAAKQSQKPQCEEIDHDQGKFARGGTFDYGQKNPNPNPNTGCGEEKRKSLRPVCKHKSRKEETESHTLAANLKEHSKANSSKCSDKREGGKADNLRTLRADYSEKAITRTPPRLLTSVRSGMDMSRLSFACALSGGQKHLKAEVRAERARLRSRIRILKKAKERTRSWNCSELYWKAICAAEFDIQELTI